MFDLDERLSRLCIKKSHVKGIKVDNELYVVNNWVYTTIVTVKIVFDVHG